jgi:DNA-binding transcriptional MerR regulator/effector-binding domain-containing protein
MADEARSDDAKTGEQVTDPYLTIGAFARRSLLSPKALRLYDRQGLLVPAEVDPASRYRRYRESQIGDARLIARLRRLEMPLAVIAEVMAASPDRRSDRLVEWWDAIERRMGGQRELLVHLLIAMSGKERSFAMYQIEERDIPEQVVLTEQRHTTVRGLTDWLGACLPRLHALAGGVGGSAGPAFIIYHGEVSEESDGPVEVCVPIAADRRSDTGAPTRTEPAHREAYTRIRKVQVAYPQILDAYDAVAQWTATNNRQVAAAPREVYFTDFMNSGPDDEVVDIAFPIA